MDVSVIVPAYNAAPYIEECLASLVRSTQSLEVIVVNDGSTDSTIERMKEAFDLVQVRGALRSRIEAKPVKAMKQ